MFKIKNKIIIISISICIIVSVLVCLLYFSHEKRDFYFGFSRYRILITGDSIETPESGWAYGLADILRFKKITYFAVGGTKLQGEINSDERISKMPNNADIIVCGGGTNDWANNVIIGDTDNINDSNSFAYAVNIMIDKLLIKYPKSIIVFVTPIFGFSPNRHNFNDKYGIKNNNGNSLYDYAKCMIEVCKNRNISCIDLYTEASITQKNYKYYLKSETNDYGDNTYFHPNTKAKDIIATKISIYMMKNILPTLTNQQ
jgi:hypothetical protein